MESRTDSLSESNKVSKHHIPNTVGIMVIMENNTNFFSGTFCSFKGLHPQSAGGHGGASTTPSRDCGEEHDTVMTPIHPGVPLGAGKGVNSVVMTS